MISKLKPWTDKMNFDWDLIKKHLDNETSPAESAKIEELRKSNPKFKKEVELLTKVWKTPADNLPKPDVDKALASVKAKIELEERNSHSASRQTEIYRLDKIQETKSPFFKPFNSYIIRAAAVLFIFLAGVYFVSKIFSGPEMKTIFVNNLEHLEISLPDGTIVKLDAGASLQYSENFGNEERNVLLNGEGYFEVTPNPDKPFTILANNAVVTVLGTAFNLRAWEGDGKTTIAVAEGKVSFKENKEQNAGEVILTEGYASTITGDSPPSTPVETDINEHLLWLNKEMGFKSASLKEILDQLNRWYDLEFILPNNSYLNDRLTIYLKNDSIENILDLVSITMNLQYERKENIITFTNY
ncbi:FecR family protein [Bacteroidota bacterium]